MLGLSAWSLDDSATTQRTNDVRAGAGKFCELMLRTAHDPAGKPGGPVRSTRSQSIVSTTTSSGSPWHGLRQGMRSATTAYQDTVRLATIAYGVTVPVIYARLRAGLLPQLLCCGKPRPGMSP